MVLPLWKTLWRVLKKLKMELLCDPEIPPLGIYIQKNLKQELKEAFATHVHCTIIHNSPEMEATKMSKDG